MSPAGKRVTPRYQRRILVIGLFAFLALCALAAPLYLRAVEHDLADRVPRELAGAGFAGVTATMSGQDATLRCSGPLTDPEAAIDAAYRVHGIHSITLDRSCRVTAAPIVDGANDHTTSGGETGTGAEADFASVADIMASDPQFSLLSVLSAEAGLSGWLSDPDAAPVTVFAPTDAAFDALPPDVVAELRSDPELLARVLRHHIVPNALTTEQLESGELTNIDRSGLGVSVTADEVTVGGATLIATDVAAGNGVVHAIDRVLVPPGVDLSGPVAETGVAATLERGVIILEGAVASADDRSALVDAAAVPDDREAVVDRLDLDPEAGLAGADVVAVARLVEALREWTVSGRVDGVAGELSISGDYATELELLALRAVTDELDADESLRPRPAATQRTASDLEQAVNEFVDANPIRFESGATALSQDAAPIVARVVAMCRTLGGVVVTVEGHTDSAGDPAENMTLSRTRADNVVDALVAGGLGGDGATVRAEGHGSTAPILDDGVEDLEASRRVELRIEVDA